MSTFRVEFEIDGKYLEHVYDLAAKVKAEPTIQRVVDRRRSGRAGGKTGPQTVGEMVAAAKKPLAWSVIRDGLHAAGFETGASTHISGAIKRGLIKKTAKGYVKGLQA